MSVLDRCRAHLHQVGGQWNETGAALAALFGVFTAELQATCDELDRLGEQIEVLQRKVSDLERASGVRGK